MSLNFFIDVIITFTIMCFFIFIVILITLFIYNILNYSGIISIERHAGTNPDNRIIVFIIQIMRTSSTYLFIYLLIVTVILSFTFWIWLIILYFVPHLVFIGFIPIPIKIPILEFVPPFKALTDRGVLPLIRRMNSRILDFFITRNSSLHQDNLEDLFSYIFDESLRIIKDAFTKLFLILNINYEIADFIPAKKKVTYIPPEIEMDEETIKDEAEAKKIQKSYEEDDDKIKLKNLINEEIAICIANKSKLLTSDLSSSESLYQTQTNRSNYAQCYAKTINLYINNEI